MRRGVLADLIVDAIWPGIKIVSIVVLPIIGVYRCQNSEWNKARQRQEEAEARANAIPHVIREAEGCKVYAWKGGDWHYFTRCGETVTTERHYTVPCGPKNQSRCDRKEVIVTEGNKP